LITAAGFTSLVAGLYIAAQGQGDDESVPGRSHGNIPLGIGLAGLGLALVPVGLVIFGNTFGLETELLGQSNTGLRLGRAPSVPPTPMLGFRGTF
jgi:hypothetical protein